MAIDRKAEAKRVLVALKEHYGWTRAQILNWIQNHTDSVNRDSKAWDAVQRVMDHTGATKKQIKEAATDLTNTVTP